MVRHVAAGPGVDGGSRGGCSGPGPSYYRTVGNGGRWASAFGEGRLGIALRADWRVPPALEEGQQAELRAAVQELPAPTGIGLANWNWRAVHRFVREHFGLSLYRSSCLNCLHRLGFAFKRPRKRLVKADEAKREAFVPEYAALVDEVERTGGKIFFADEAHFRADAEPRASGR